jgi:flagellum-specific ATP synthase
MPENLMNRPSADICWSRYMERLGSCRSLRLEGRIVKLAGIVAEANGPGLGVGSLCGIDAGSGENIAAEVIGFNDRRLVLMPFGELAGVRPGSRVVGISGSPGIRVGEAYLGRVIDGLGLPIDGKGSVRTDDEYPLYGNPINPLRRGIIREVMDVGVRSINAMTTIGKGQRMAVMAGSGVGKSVLMGMMARNTAADVSIIALIGERGREVREFIEKKLGDSGLKKSIVVAATSDAPALVRIRSAYVATTLAEYFRDRGADVLLVMDSITRVAMSLREIGLAAGEPPTAKGYTPSVFSRLPKLLERAGNIEGSGSVTGIYNVLVEGDDMNEPVADSVRSIVDGHIVLSRAIAHRGHYPAVDVPASVSRVMKEIAGDDHLAFAKKAVRTLTTYREAEDLINIGAYSDGSDPGIDYAKKMIGRINTFLQQDIQQKVSFEESVSQLGALFGAN